MLKGKAKIDFEEWFYSNDEIYDVCMGLIDDMTGSIQMFWKLPPTMQQGVLLEFFREKGYSIEWFSRKDGLYIFMLCGKAVKSDRPISEHKDYSTAFTHAIDKACEIYNGKGGMMKRICEYPECNELGFPIGQKEGSVILCPEHEKALDYLLDNEREKEAIEFILTVTANRIQNNLTNNGKEN